MTYLQIKAIRAVVERESGEAACAYCNYIGIHKSCPIGVLQNYLASLDADTGETVTITGVVAVGEDGEWVIMGNSQGWKQNSVGDAIEAYEQMGHQGGVCPSCETLYLEAVVSIPKPLEMRTVKATVAKVEE